MASARAAAVVALIPLVASGCGGSASSGAPTAPTPAPISSTQPAPAPPSPASPGEITACGFYTGPGPFTVTADINSNFRPGCLSFQNNVAGQLDCQGHNAISISIGGAHGFAVRNCTLNVGSLQALSVTDSDGVVLDNVNIAGFVTFRNASGLVLRNSTVQYPVTKAAPVSTTVGAVVLIEDGHDNTLVHNTIIGGYDGNLATWGRQGSDDGILIGNDESNLVVQDNDIRDVFDAGIEVIAPGPHTIALVSNRITNAGYTGIGAYYVASWQNSTFRGNSISDTPSLLDFEVDREVQPNPIFVGNTFEGNTFRDPVRLPPTYGGPGFPQSMRILYTGAPPATIENNVIRNNDFGTASPGPYINPIDGFIDGGGNICAEPSSISCSGAPGFHALRLFQSPPAVVRHPSLRIRR